MMRQIPGEVCGTGQLVQVEPYYIIIKRLGEEKAEFVLMSSFTPIRKDNMVAWLADRSDGDTWGAGGPSSFHPCDCN